MLNSSWMVAYHRSGLWQCEPHLHNFGLFLGDVDCHGAKAPRNDGGMGIALVSARNDGGGGIALVSACNDYISTILL